MVFSGVLSRILKIEVRCVFILFGTVLGKPSRLASEGDQERLSRSLTKRYKNKHPGSYSGDPEISNGDNLYFNKLTCINEIIKDEFSARSFLLSEEYADDTIAQTILLGLQSLIARIAMDQISDAQLLTEYEQLIMSYKDQYEFAYEMVELNVLE